MILLNIYVDLLFNLEDHWGNTKKIKRLDKIIFDFFYIYNYKSRGLPGEVIMLLYELNILLSKIDHMLQVKKFQKNVLNRILVEYVVCLVLKLNKYIFAYGM